MAGEPASLAEAVGAFLVAERGDSRRRAAASILAMNPDADLLESLLKKGRDYSSDVPRGWVVAHNVLPDGSRHGYHLFVPSDYDPAKRLPLVVHMHGGVSRPVPIDDERFGEYREQMWGEVARGKGWFLVLPKGCAEVAWWTENGLHNLLGVLDRIRLAYNVDENRIFATGFSDGGSGSFFLAMNCSTPFAGFLPLNGFPPVAGAGGHEVFLPNAANKPMAVVNTTADSLYPAKLVTPFIEAMREAGARVDYKVYEDIGHTPAYWPQERSRLAGFVEKTVRAPHPAEITWETADPARFGRTHWIRIDAVDEGIGDAPELARDYNPRLRDERIRLGIFIDQAHPGPGVWVDRLVDGASAAGRIGLEPGDVIVEMDGKNVGDLRDLQALLRLKRPGDEVTVAFLRDGERREGATTFEDPAPRPAFTRRGVAGRVTARCEGNRILVRARNVARFTVFVSRDRLDVEKPVRVETNGERSFEGMVKPDVAFMLERAAEDNDRTMVYWAEIPIDVGADGEDDGESEF